jgi:hypothetical protein
VQIDPAAVEPMLARSTAAPIFVTPWRTRASIRG